jgi:hypothetical protein
VPSTVKPNRQACEVPQGNGGVNPVRRLGPFNPKKVSSFHIGGIVRRATHPLNGGPMVEDSRDGQRVYFTRRRASDAEGRLKGLWIDRRANNSDKTIIFLSPDLLALL